MPEKNRSAFDFSDGLGSDPVVRRYRPMDYMDIAEAEAQAVTSEAQRQSAEAGFARAQAELDAQLAPMKFAQEQVKSMSDMLKMKSAMQEEIAVQQNAAALTEGLSKAQNLDEVVSLGNTHLMGLKDGVAGPMWRTSALNAFRQLTDNAQSIAEVDTAYSKIPASVASEPEFKGSYDTARKQAELREGVRKQYAATPSLGAIPTAEGGQVDVTAAGMAIAAMGGEEQRRNTAIENAKILQKQIGDLRDQMKADQATSETGEPKESDTLLLQTYQRQLERTLTEIGILPSAVPGATGATPATPVAPPATAAPAQPPVGDSVGSVLPPEAVRSAGAPAAAAASNAATGGMTATPAAGSTTPSVPKTLAEEAAAAAEKAAPASVAPGSGRAAKAAEATRMREERNRIQLLKDERTKLQSAIYQRLGRGGGNRLTTRLKPGLTEDNDVVQRTLARINEITAELGE